jgi:hypothetical protein
VLSSESNETTSAPTAELQDGKDRIENIGIWSTHWLLFGSRWL